MNISRMLNHLFSENKNLEINQNQQNKKKDQFNQNVDIKQVMLNNLSATSLDAETALKKIKDQAQKGASNSHALDAGRVSALLSGEKTSRLDAIRTEVLKNVIGEQNQASLIQTDTLAFMKKIVSNTKA